LGSVISNLLSAKDQFLSLKKIISPPIFPALALCLPGRLAHSPIHLGYSPKYRDFLEVRQADMSLKEYITGTTQALSF
jgi:hypothetical protein